MMRVRILFGLLCAVSCVAGCDPGRSYSIPGARSVRADGLLDAIAVEDGVEARFRASIFTIHGWSEVQVVNVAAEPIEFQPESTLIIGADGSRIPAECKLPTEKVQLARGQMISVRCGFTARLRRSSYEPQFDNLTLFQPGFSRSGKMIAVLANLRGS